MLCVSSPEKGTVVKRRIPFAAVHSPSLSSYLYSASIPLAGPTQPTDTVTSPQAPHTVTPPKAPHTVTSPQTPDVMTSPQAPDTESLGAGGPRIVTSPALEIAVRGAPWGGSTAEGGAHALVQERRALARPGTPEAQRRGPAWGLPGERVRIPNKGQVQLVRYSTVDVTVLLLLQSWCKKAGEFHRC